MDLHVFPIPILPPCIFNFNSCYLKNSYTIYILISFRRVSVFSQPPEYLILSNIYMGASLVGETCIPIVV